jgi:hypothetical protein
MTVDYLDPFRPVTPPEVPEDRHDEPAENRESEPVREDVPREEQEAYDDRGDSVDEYA